MVHIPVAVKGVFLEDLVLVLVSSGSAVGAGGSTFEFWCPHVICQPPSEVVWWESDDIKNGRCNEAH